MMYLKEIVKKNKVWIGIYIVVGIVLAFLTNLSANYYQQLIDHFTAGTLTFRFIIIYGSVLLLICIGNYLDEYPGRKLENGIYLDLKVQALKKVSCIDYQTYQSLGTGELLQKIESGSGAGKRILFDFYFEMARKLLPSIGFSMLFIWRLNTSIAYAVLAGYILVFVITNILLRSLYHLKEKILNNEEQMTHFLTRGFMEMVTFRLHRKFKAEIAHANHAKTQIVDSKIKMSLIHEAFFTLFALLVTLIKIGIILYAWFTKSLTIGAVIALITLVDHAYTPIAIFNVLFVQYKLDQSAFKRYTHFLDAKEDKQLQIGEPLQSLQGAFNICQIDFAYSKQMIFKDLSLAIQAGEKIAFVGGSGSGKSTLVKLLIGLLKPTCGEIQIDGQVLSKICLEDYYKQILYIPQESPIFDGTLRENLIFDKQIADEEIVAVLKRVCLEEWFTKLSHGLETQLGERGITLSGGERQRLALARIWFQDSKVIILDEATSAMDNLTEEQVMKAVLEVAASCTVITIAHRLNAIKDFDRILAFRMGTLVGEGRFSELLAHNDYFKELYHVGSLEE